MAIKIKRSTGNLAPAELAAGQLAYVEGSENGGTLYYGEIGGTVREIAGRKYVDKLNGIEAGAQVNTVTSVAGRTGAVTIGVSDVSGAEATANKGQANGYASLDANGLVPSSQLPSYVDDVVEAANFAALPATGETGKIYVTIDDGKAYRWGGSVYVEIVASPGSTDALAEGSTNLYYTDARARAAISVDGDLSYDSGTGVISYTGPANVSELNNDSGYITAVADDTAPALGGNLDTTGFNITGDNILIKPVTDGQTKIESADGFSAVEVADAYAGMYTANGGVEVNDGEANIYGTSVVIGGLNFPVADGTSGQILTTDGLGNVTFEDAPATGLQNVVEDTTPQLGGNLDTQTYEITSAASNDIKLNPASGQIRVIGEQIALESSQSDAYVTTIGAKDLKFNTNQGDSSGSIVIFDGANQNIELVPNGTGKVRLGNNYYPSTEGTTGQYLKIGSSAGQFEFANFPTIPTSTSQLSNDSGYITAVSDDSAPALGGDLDIGTHAITTSETDGNIAVTLNGSGKVVINSGMMIDSANIYSPDENTYVYVANGNIELGSSDGTNTSAIYVYETGEVQIDAPVGLTLNGIVYPAADGTVGQVLTTDGAGNATFEDLPAGISAFTELSDVPSAFTGAAGYYVKVNSGATALEFSQDVDDGTF